MFAQQCNRYIEYNPNHDDAVEEHLNSFFFIFPLVAAAAAAARCFLSIF